ncbi:hypothetical protein BD410DRAFT_831333 [Rickenella mellea]|uniref:DUF6533 domain-containing protein n=1 Tax=Rickenella mellea TaxID=50990 RepID=A0A4Y7PS98_9AGAM|nr:hypothetical protein BD410DRAFT_831333 [Rickenella mellea]
MTIRIKHHPVAAFAIAVWDYFILLPDEVALIWPSRWTVSKCLFFMNRYSVFIDPFMLIYVLMIGRDEHSCSINVQIQAYLRFFGAKICQLILIWRTYAVWGCKLDKAVIILSFLYLGMNGPEFWAAHKYITGLQLVIIPGVPGCVVVSTNRWVWWPIMQLMIVESVLIILLAFRAFQHVRIGRTSLISVMYYDGLLYYICIQVSLIANLVVVLVTTIALKSFLLCLQRVLQSVLCTRIMLHIRRVHKNKADGLQRGETLTTMEFNQISSSSYLNDM